MYFVNHTSDLGSKKIYCESHFSSGSLHVKVFCGPHFWFRKYKKSVNFSIQSRITDSDKMELDG